MTRETSFGFLLTTVNTKVVLLSADRVIRNQRKDFLVSFRHSENVPAASPDVAPGFSRSCSS